MARHLMLRGTILALTLFATGAGAQNLVANPGFEAGNSGFGNDYNLSPGALSPSHSYDLIARPSLACASFADFGDHTTGSGRMLVVHGAAAPLGANAAWRQSVAVTANTSYTFGVWYASASPANPPRFQVFVNGVATGAPVQMPAETGSWQSASVHWNSGKATDALLEIRLLGAGADGNVCAFDDASLVRGAGTVPAASPWGVGALTVGLMAIAALFAARRRATA
jgi:hypothetical protein